VDSKLKAGQIRVAVRKVNQARGSKRWARRRGGASLRFSNPPALNFLSANHCKDELGYSTIQAARPRWCRCVL